MTTADATRTVAPTDALDLRRRIHARLEEEYLRLRGVDRPELLVMSAARVEDGVDPDVVGGELDVVEKRVDALHRHFAALAADAYGPAAGRVLLLDLGAGPELALVSEIDLPDDQVIAADSPLGLALRDAETGQVVTYLLPHGVGRARVLAAEGPAVPPSRIAATSDEDIAPTGWFSTPASEVLVGFDGSPSARSAVAWAAKEAALRARPLRVLHAREDVAEPAAEPDPLLSEGIELASQALPPDDIRASALEGSAGPRLAERAGAAEMVVVGRGGENDTTLGPVARDVLGRTSRITVVVPPEPDPAPHHRVVVGLRESRHAAEALAVGFAEANRRGADLVVTVVRDVESDGATVGGLAPAFHAADEDDAVEADHLPQAVAKVGRAFPAVEATTSLRTGHFAEVLVEMSDAADLVVLGMGPRRTGMGGKDLLIATHARCPVIVVRETPTGGGS